MNTQLSFKNAETYCNTEFGGNLASITSTSEFQAVMTILDNMQLNERMAIFIGGIESKSRWTWTSGI